MFEPRVVKYQLNVVAANITNDGLTTAKDAMPHFGFRGDRGALVCWLKEASEKNPIQIDVGGVQNTEIEPDPDEVSEWLRKQYFSRPEFRQSSIRSGISATAVLAFAVSNGKIARVPRTETDGQAMPRTFEDPSLGISIDGFPTCPVTIRPFKFEAWNGVLWK